MKVVDQQVRQSAIAQIGLGCNHALNLQVVVTLGQIVVLKQSFQEADRKGTGLLAYSEVEKWVEGRYRAGLTADAAATMVAKVCVCVGGCVGGAWARARARAPVRACVRTCARVHARLRVCACAEDAVPQRHRPGRQQMVACHQESPDGPRPLQRIPGQRRLQGDTNTWSGQISPASTVHQPTLRGRCHCLLVYR